MVILGLAIQVLGLLAVLAGCTWLIGPWALVIGGVVLFVFPEIAERL